MSEDWLELPEAVDQHKLLQTTLNDNVRGAERNPMLPVGVDPEYAEAIRALRTLRPNQRSYIRAYMATGGRRTAAIRRLEDAFIKIDPSAVSRWHKNSNFLRALELSRKLLLKTSDVDPVSLMLRAGEVIEHSLTPHPILNRDGQVVGHDMDPSSAMRGIEWLGKVHRMTEDDRAVRVTFEMVNIADRSDAIDVTPTEKE